MMLNDYIVMMYADLIWAVFFLFCFVLISDALDLWQIIKQVTYSWSWLEQLQRNLQRPVHQNSLDHTNKGKIPRDLSYLSFWLSVFQGKERKQHEQDLNALFWQVIKIPTTTCLLPLIKPSPEM